MGKGSVPEYSWWGFEKLSYIEARQFIYLPIYVTAVLKSPAWRQLAALYRASDEIVLWDFDGYDYHRLGMTFKDVLLDPTRKMGHALILAALLEKTYGMG